MSTPGPSQPDSGWYWLVVIGFLSVAVVGVGVWKYTTMPPRDHARPGGESDLVAAAHANARGIARMEHYDYPKAIEAFEEAVRFAPDWTPAKVNLGIALLNRGNDVPAELDRALWVFGQVLDKEPNNPHAHFCTGLIHFHRGELRTAAPHFIAVTKSDENDAHAWYFRGRCTPDSDESAEARECFEKALKLNPYLNAARHNLAHHRLVADDAKRRKQLLDEFELLARTDLDQKADVKYSETGRYGDVITTSPVAPPAVGVMPLFDPVKGPVAKLADGTAWAGDNLDDSLKQLRARFGGAMLLLDYNRDGKSDVLLLGAVTRGGKIGDVLFRNDGNNTFTDVTAAVGLDKHLGSLGGAVGDYDNDGLPDLALAGAGGLRLLRNAGGKAFEDTTAAAGFDKEAGGYLTATWVDLDQDGDLDLVAGKGTGKDDDGGLVVFANVGEAPPGQPGQPLPPLVTAFKRLTEPEALLVKGPVVGIVVTDVDRDRDLDLIVLLQGHPPVTVLNDRLLRFHRGDAVTGTASKWCGGLVLDANGDEQSDIVLVGEGRPEILVSKRDGATENVASRFAAGATDSPLLRSAAWTDLDLDGRADLLGVSADGKAVLLQGDGTGKFTRKLAPFGPDAEAMKDLLAVAPVDVDGDGNPDVLAWSEAGGLRVIRSLGNGNNSLRVTVTGKWDKGKYQRTNTDGVGCWVRVHAGPLHTGAENTTLSAGLGQSRLPLHFGLGKATTAEGVRVHWPDGVIQAEVNQTAGRVTILELNRKPVSCPVLFVWDGERFAYVTDILGAGSMGEGSAEGATRPPRPEESVKIEPGKWVPKNGKYVLKLAEPMDELMYIDRLRLDVIDHPTDVNVYPDERFATADPQPTQERLFFRESERVFPVKAVDHRGRDVAATLRDRDGQHVEGFAKRLWIGFAEEHWVELDFAGALKKLPAGRKVYLVSAGWIDYAYPESIYAATQAGVPMIPPVLEQKQRDGTWKKLGEIGFPAGLTRVMTTEVTNWIDPDGGPVRIRTNLHVYWDQLFVAPLAAGVGPSVRELPVSRAALEYRGFAQEYSPGGKLPIAYDYDRLENVLVTRWKGKITRTGDVTALLGADDDRFVIGGPGDEITAEFDATNLPSLPAGWKRSLVLRSWGYCKDSAPTTFTGGAVGPLSYRGMPPYPYDPARNPPPAALGEYDQKWNTRPVGGR